MTCKNCGKEFKVKYCREDERDFCSKDCYYEWVKKTGSRRGKNHVQWKKKIPKNCENCGKKFKVPPSRKDARFCSLECYHEYIKGENNPHHKDTTEVECDWCGKTLERKPWQLRDHNFCDKDCFGKWNAQNLSVKKVKRKCKYCGKTFFTYPSKVRNGGGVYCSKECRDKVFENSGKESRFSQGHIPWNKKPKITKICKQCGKKFKVRSCRKDTAKFCSRECSGKFNSKGKDNPHWKGKVTKVCEQCGKKFKVLQYRKDTARFCSKKCRIKGMNSLPTKPEKKIINLIKKHSLPFKYVGDGDFILGGKNPDFVDTDGSKKVIEVFGDYWHEPEEEQERKEHFSKYGFDTLVLWEHEINQSTGKEIMAKMRGF